jgi:phytoene desaturase
MAKAIIIGSGIAGLATALRLRKKGYEVEVYEANAYAGGKIHAFEREGYRFDAGPSLFTLPHLIDELFQLYDLQPSDHFRYKAKSISCNYFWEDGTTFSAPANALEFARQAAVAFSTAEQALHNYIKRSKKKYDITKGVFLEKSLHQWRTYFSTNTLKAIFQFPVLEIGSTLHAVNEKHFSNPHLIQLFNRYATYNGSSPYKTPGIMSMIPHLEMNLGTYYPEGGMHSISQCLYQLALHQGIRFYFNQRVDTIVHEIGRAIGIKTKNTFHPADVVVSNMDIFSTYEKLLSDVAKPERTLRQERSSSALIFYWGVKREFPQLELHNILFSRNYRKEFEKIGEGEDPSEDPTVYINITAKEEQHAPAGCENWFVMINVPSNHGQDWEKIKVEARKNILAKINRILKVRMEDVIEMEEVLDPIRIEISTSSHQGSLYGTASNSRFAAFLRHPNFSSKIKNLYFCGGSVHPGGGIPLCLLSAKIVADNIQPV